MHPERGILQPFGSRKAPISQLAQHARSTLVDVPYELPPHGRFGTQEGLSQPLPVESAGGGSIASWHRRS